MNPGFWLGKRVLVTGHTGFKGGWLSLWLNSLGAKVHGFALAPATEPNLFTIARVQQAMASSRLADVRHFDDLAATLRQVRPDIVFHLAARAVVGYCRQNPVEAYAVNVMGAVHVLEAARVVGGVKAIVNVTSDKCYENDESPTAMTEARPLGGRDPYSSSKACAELVTTAYRSSYFADSGVGLASARAGNVIGGGDWAADRLLPDVVRALNSGSRLAVRSPEAVRPWQHVLEPLAGYLILAERLCTQSAEFAGAWNFGPPDADLKSVRWIVEYLSARNPGLIWNLDTDLQPHEAQHLRLDSAKARRALGWRPRWSLPQALDKTLEWHQALRSERDMHEVTLAQVGEYAARHDPALRPTGTGHGTL